jgi:hypothetical protein
MCSMIDSTENYHMVTLNLIKSFKKYLVTNNSSRNYAQIAKVVSNCAQIAKVLSNCAQIAKVLSL